MYRTVTACELVGVHIVTCAGYRWQLSILISDSLTCLHEFTNSNRFWLFSMCLPLFTVIFTWSPEMTSSTVVLVPVLEIRFSPFNFVSNFLAEYFYLVSYNSFLSFAYFFRLLDIHSNTEFLFF